MLFNLTALTLQPLYSSSVLFVIIVLICIFPIVNQTDHTQPNTLIIANCEVVKPRVAAESHIANV